jgi:hypothetical protein
LSSFRKIGDIDKIPIAIDDSDVITLPEEGDVIKIRNIRYRKADLSDQDHIYHYIFSQKDCKKVYLHSKGWHVEIKYHSPCPLKCKDEFGGKQMVARYGYRDELTGEIVEEVDTTNYVVVKAEKHNDNPFCSNCAINEKRMILQDDNWYCTSCGSIFATTDVKREDMSIEEDECLRKILESHS